MGARARTTMPGATTAPAGGMPGATNPKRAVTRRSATMRSATMRSAIVAGLTWLLATSADAGAGAGVEGHEGLAGHARLGSVASAARAAQEPSARVETEQGPVIGVEGADTIAWKGIPFAAPPVGDLRWRAPRPAPLRDAPLDASDYGPACPQDARDVLAPGAGETERRGSEDCLTLNVWRPRSPDSGAGLPVLFWIHGGGHVQGSGSEPLYDGARLAAARGVVVVTINYRLGALGFLVHPAFVDQDPEVPGAGNYGRLDQLAALDWVRANIAGFGGDPDRIAIFGESAGGVSVCDLVASPLAAGRFRAAIMQSGACLDDRAIPRIDEAVGALPPATEQGERFADAAGCGDTSRPADCLRALPAETVLDTLPGEAGILNAGAETYGPVIDGYVHPESPAAAVRSGTANDVAFVVGANADEGTIFLNPAMRSMGAAAFRMLVGSFFPAHEEAILALYPLDDYDTPGDAFAAITGDVAFVCNARRAARQHAEAGRRAWLYHFTHVPAYAVPLGVGSHHGAEIPFVFASPAVRARPDERALSDAMQSAWSALAAELAPSVTAGGREAEWPRYDVGANVGFRFATGPELGPVEGWREAKCDLWDEVAAAGPPAPDVTSTPSASGTPSATSTSVVETTPTSIAESTPTPTSSAESTPTSPATPSATGGTGQPGRRRAYFPWLALEHPMAPAAP